MPYTRTRVLQYVSIRGPCPRGSSLSLPRITHPRPPEDARLAAPQTNRHTAGKFLSVTLIAAKRMCRDRGRSGHVDVFGSVTLAARRAESRGERHPLGDFDSLCYDGGLFGDGARGEAEGIERVVRPIHERVSRQRTQRSAYSSGSEENRLSALIGGKDGGDMSCATSFGCASLEPDYLQCHKFCVVQHHRHFQFDELVAVHASRWQ